MKQLVIAALVLAAIFASTFIMLNLTGVITAEKIKWGMVAAGTTHRALVSALVILLLSLDIVIAIPTLTVMVLAGHFLGFGYGAVSAICGLYLAGLIGYGVSRKYGTALLAHIYKSPEKLLSMQQIFDRHGPVALLLCRALPILPEVTCCLAGANRMPFLRFLFYYSLATIPYACIAVYAGSKSTIDNPTPALLTAITLSLILWLAWTIFLRRVYVATPDKDPVQASSLNK